jgi:uncharacterized membrane protein YfcA
MELLTESFVGYDPVTLLLLVLAAFVAGWVDSIAGGGGLISLPALIMAGLPPTVALGTNKFQSSFGSFTSSLHYVRSGLVDFSDAGFGIFFTFVGAATGTWLVQCISADYLSFIIPFLMLAIAIYMLLSPDLGKIEKHVARSRFILFMVLGIVIGFYDGFFGPGTGNFWVLALMVWGGFHMTRATAYTKVMNFTSNIVALIVFAIGGNIRYELGLLMALGQISGARIGAGMVLKYGVQFIRPVFIFVVIVLAIVLFIRNYT